MVFLKVSGAPYLSGANILVQKQRGVSKKTFVSEKNERGSFWCFKKIAFSENFIHKTGIITFVKNCLTLPKISLGNPLVFLKASGIEKLYIRGGFTIFCTNIFCGKVLGVSGIVYLSGAKCSLYHRGGYHKKRCRKLFGSQKKFVMGPLWCFRKFLVSKKIYTGYDDFHTKFSVSQRQKMRRGGALVFLKVSASISFQMRGIMNFGHGGNF